MVTFWYFDLDDTLTDFTCVLDPYRFVHLKGWFANLKPKDTTFINYLTTRKDTKNHILSHLPVSPYAEEEKIDWCHKYIFGVKDQNILLLPFFKPKSTMVPNLTPLHILVDDNISCVKDWVLKGGTGVHFTGDYIVHSQKGKFLVEGSLPREELYYKILSYI